MRTFAAILVIASTVPVFADEPRRARLADEAQSRHHSLAIEDAYREILASHARGDSRAALEALGELEARFLSSDAARCLDKVRRNTLGELARSDPESLLPALALHVSSWSEHMGRERVLRATATRELLEDFLAVYVRKDVPESAAAASRLLVHWSRLMAGYGYLFLLEDLTEIFELALAYDPANVPALDAGSMIHERLGDYDTALSLLERRLEIRGDSAAVRLRAALNRLRRNPKTGVTAELRELAHSQETPWIRIVAYQELVGYHGRSGSPGGSDRDRAPSS